MDATHLLANLSSALPECLYLESRQPHGSRRLLADLALLTLLTNGLYGGWVGGVVPLSASDQAPLGCAPQPAHSRDVLWVAGAGERV
jgi:hypothetical protein